MTKLRDKQVNKSKKYKNRLKRKKLNKRDINTPPNTLLESYRGVRGTLKPKRKR